jgi:hypothetical protein
MTKRMAEVSLRLKTRFTGIVYLFYFLSAVLSAFFVRGLVISGDAAATAANILAHESSFQLGFAVSLISFGLYITVTALFYNLFKSVNRSLALLAVFFSLVGCAIQVFGSLFRLAPLILLSGSPYLNVFKVEQLQSLGQMFLELSVQAGYIGLVFFGCFNLLIGYLIFRSTFLPRILGVLMALSGLGWLTFLSPPLTSDLLPYTVVLGILAEGSLMLWLLVMGVNISRWEKHAGVAKQPDQSVPGRAAV